MSQAAAQASAFYRDVARHRRLWTIRDKTGFPAPMTPEGRAMPFWSSRRRVDRIISNDPYKDFSPVELTWEEFRDRWLPGLATDGIKVGVNWTGTQATGYDVPPDNVRSNVEYHLGIQDPDR